MSQGEHKFRVDMPMLEKQHWTLDLIATKTMIGDVYVTFM